MRDAVAITAFREFRVNSRCMRSTVTIRTQRHGLMLVGMTTDTGNVLMLVRISSQQVVCSLMTGGTHDICGGIRIGDSRRHMRLVAGTAVRLRHLRGMWLMTLNTFGNYSVTLGMAEVTSQQSVLAGVGIKLRLLRIVAGQAGRGQLTRKGNLEGLVRVMTTDAVGQSIVGSPFMTHAAFGDIVLHLGRMTDVAILAGDRSFVLRPQSRDVRRFAVMTLDAVGIGQQHLFCHCIPGNHQNQAAANQ